METSPSQPPCNNKRHRKVGKKWLSEEVNLLISLMEERKCLWDYGTQDYRNRDLRESKWLEISKETGRSITDCKAQWNTVKSRYNAERRKECSTKSGQSGERYSSRYEYFNALAFLNSVCERPAGSTQTNMTTFDIDILDTPIIIDHMKDGNSDEADGLSSPKIPRRDAVTPDRSALLNRISSYLDTRLQDPSWKWVFAEHVYCELGRYSETDAHKLKRQINSVLDNFEPDNDK